uniref:Uncharacterized protein n=1 Tax=mine drainage metagenome TaxID=410659 RepID=E6QIE8_9ZZZZ
MNEAKVIVGNFGSGAA